MCCTHLAFVVAAVAAVVVAVVAAVVGLCYMVLVATKIAMSHMMPSDNIVGMFVQRRVCGSVHHRESKWGHQQAGARGQAR